MPEPRGIHDGWEDVHDSAAPSDHGADLGIQTSRLAVPGGWIYRLLENDGDVEVVFVPEPAQARQVVPFMMPTPFPLGPSTGLHHDPLVSNDGPPEPDLGVFPGLPEPYVPPPPPTKAELRAQIMKQLSGPEAQMYYDIVLEVLETPQAQRILSKIRDAISGAKACPVCLGSGEHAGRPCPACGKGRG